MVLLYGAISTNTIYGTVDGAPILKSLEYILSTRFNTYRTRIL